MSLLAWSGCLDIFMSNQTSQNSECPAPNIRLFTITHPSHCHGPVSGLALGLMVERTDTAGRPLMAAPQEPIVSLPPASAGDFHLYRR